jgi:hypothetical protein
MILLSCSFMLFVLALLKMRLIEHNQITPVVIGDLIADTGLVPIGIMTQQGDLTIKICYILINIVIDPFI